MSLGLLTFVFTQRLLQGGGLPPRAAADAPADGPRLDRDRPLSRRSPASSSGHRAWPYFRPLWSRPGSSTLAVPYKGAVLVAALRLPLRDGAAEDGRPGRRARAVHAGLAADRRYHYHQPFSIVFWMGFEQSGGTLNLFAEREDDRTSSATKSPRRSSRRSTRSSSSAGPVFAILWTYLARRKFPLPSVAKQGLGLALLARVRRHDLASERARAVSPWWLIAVYLIFTVAELFVSPDRPVAGQQAGAGQGGLADDGVWFLCTAAANLSGRNHGENHRAVPLESLGVSRFWRLSPAS